MRVPSLCLLVLLLALAALTGILLDGKKTGDVPRAFVESQEQLAVSTARTIGASTNQSLSDLRTATTGNPVGPDPLLDALVKNRRWRGAAVLSGSGRTLLAARGEQVPIEALPAAPITDSAVTSVIAANGELHLVSAIALPDDRVLVATSAVRLPNAGPDDGLRQSLILTTTSGEIVGSAANTLPAEASGDEAQPQALPAQAPELNDLISAAGRASATGEPGSLLGPAADGTQATITYAQVIPAGGEHTLDLTVVAVAYGPSGTTTSGGEGLIPAAALAAIALLGYLLIRRVLVTPVRNLRNDALDLAGGDLDVTVRHTSTPEIAKIAKAFRLSQDSLLDVGPEDHRARRGLSTLGAVLIVAVAILGWSGGTAALLATPETAVPDAIVKSLRNQTSRATEALRRSLNDGLADLEAITTVAGTDSDTLRPALEQLVDGQPRYRSVYLVDKSGVADVQVGRPPLRTEERPPAKAGIRQQNNGGRVPVLFAHVPLADGQTLIGEFDLVHLSGLLGQAPGTVRLVDADFRTISATGGYVAFEQVTSEGARRQATLAQRGETVAEIQDAADGKAIVASSAVYGGEIGKLGWTVIAESPVADLALPANETHRNALLVALIGALLAFLLFGWHLFALILPLRRVSTAADAIIADDRDGVVYPQRHDEIGTIASCLEVCRQALTHGTSRLGEVRRPTGAATERTELFSRITDDTPEPTGHTVLPAQSQRPRRPSGTKSKIGQGST
ncbi:MAG: HAMP domain-containing protein [Actinomycetota bacterium]|nr:HAMP domain-containing protein [Actinomycetota bacterium]